MLNFNRALFLFIAVMAGLIFADWYYAIHWSIYALVNVIFVSFLGYNSVRIDSQFYVPTICDADAEGKKVVLTFDDGPDPEITPQVLNILKAYQVKGTFFCIGKKIPSNEKLLRRIHEEGHLIGNHSFSHSYILDFFPFWMVRKEIRQTNQWIARVTGQWPRFFRPPYGITNPAIARALKGRDFDVIGWNIRSFDTVTREDNKVIDRVVSQLRSGGIILFHDTSPALPDILRELLDYLKEHNYEVVSLDEGIAKSAYKQPEKGTHLLESYQKKNLGQAANL